MNTSTQATTYAEQISIAAEVVEATQGLPAPCVWAYGSSGHVQVQWQLMNSDAKETQRETAKQIIRVIGGHWKKDASTDQFTFERDYRGISLEIMASRSQICERIVVGTKTVVIPAKPAEPEQTIEVDEVEWRCEPVLAAEVSA
jgi:hypothetical protein